MPTPHRDAWLFLPEPDHDRAISSPEMHGCPHRTGTDGMLYSEQSGMLYSEHSSRRDYTACSTPSI
eukprot:37616-Rhodomonas_salina.1